MTNPARELDLTGMTWADAHRTLERLQPAIADLLDALAHQHIAIVTVEGVDCCDDCRYEWPCATATARDAVAAALTGETP